MKKMIAILLVAVMALSIVACAKKDPLVGTWAVDFSEEFAQLGEDEKAMMEQLGISQDSFKAEYVFNADGTGHAEMNMYGEEETVEFTYTAKDGKITLTATQDGETETKDFEYKIEGDTLTLTVDGESQTLKRK